MKLTPGQIADLRADKNVRGRSVVNGEARPLFCVSITYQVLERVQQLTNLGAMPTHVVWYVSVANPARAEIHTTSPEWFAELEETINEARQPAR